MACPRGALVALIAGTAACGPILDAAPFASAPGARRAGELLGPFEGVVLDADTDRPVEGALVEASWAFERGLGLVGPAGAATRSLITDGEGRYRVPALQTLPGGATARVRRFTLTVYKRGYTAWRSDRVFPSGQARRDFSQRDNRVRLQRWDDSQSRARHVLFVGGGPELRRAWAWELQAAGLELSGAAEHERQPGGDGQGGGDETSGGRAPVDASGLLTEAELRLVTGYRGKLTVGRLRDLPRTEFYDTLHFRAEGRAEDDERDDVAIRLWHVGEDAALEQYRDLRGELPDPEARNELGDASVRVATPSVRALVFLLREPGVVLSLTCGVGQCPSADELLGLGKLVEARAAELTAPSGGGAP